MQYEAKEVEGAVICEGDPASTSVGVTKITLDRLLESSRPADCIALYVFYCYTARWQNAQTVKCTTGYSAEALGWSNERTIAVRAILKEMELIEDVRRLDKETKKVTGWFVKVRYLAMPAKSHTMGFPEGGQSTLVETPLSGNGGDKCLKTGNSNAEDKIKYQRKGSAEEITAYCKTLNLPESDGVACFDKWEGNGWTNNGKPIKDWKATIRSWRANFYLPSQKQTSNGKTQTNRGFNTDRNAGTKNEGRANDYAGVGKLT